ncbi:MAG TPA: Do family serine endopeptidase [Bacteroidales bacterium]|nr:Do family serine endopeptidase [Bacteroidales bacterium]HNR42899.1 Do family serine endopeptidase [Bacteroidales bacterium]HPM18277.1 Do family serine endopeptidase [Bacteroidales bacterium]HQG76691.1 Do family serine endopeptidase [Bacteroidales bacterium]
MKAKNLIGAFAMAVLGAAIALFAYSRINSNSVGAVARDSSGIELRGADTYLTSLSMQERPVDFTYAAEQTVHAVVHVTTKSMVGPQASNPIMEWFYGDRYSKPREVAGYGSGVIISDDGYIITNNHVIDNADNVEVKLNDNRVFTAEIIGRDPTTDIALLKIKANNLPFIKYGDSDQLKIGEWVLAVGNPFNLTSSVTAGIVSAKGRSLGILDADLRIESFIQTDAALNPGNSGGALVDTRGLLVGITSAIVSPSGAYAGNSFAIPVTIVRKVVEDLKQFGEVQRAIIGVNITNVSQDDAKKLKLDEVRGAKISNVVPNGAAEAAGLKENDIIIKFNGVSVASPSELQEQVGKFRPGDRASITYIRNGKENTVPIVLKNIAGNTSVVTREMSGSGTVFGARLESLGSSDREKYNIDYGVKVAELKDGKLKDLGVKKGYIILSINGRKVKNASEVRSASDNESNLKSIEGIQSDGTFFSYSFRN